MHTYMYIHICKHTKIQHRLAKGSRNPQNRYKYIHTHSIYRQQCSSHNFILHIGRVGEGHRGPHRSQQVGEVLGGGAQAMGEHLHVSRAGDFSPDQVREVVDW